MLMEEKLWWGREYDSGWKSLRKNDTEQTK